MVRILNESYKGLNIAPFRPFKKEDYYGWAGAGKLPNGDEPLIYEDDNATFIIAGDEGEIGCTVDVYAGEDLDTAYSSDASGDNRLSFPKALQLAKKAVEASKAGYDELIYWCDTNLEEY